MKEIKRTPFGIWFMSLPRVKRYKVLDEFKKGGINEPTARTWMTKETVPRSHYHTTIEKVTELKIEELFPF